MEYNYYLTKNRTIICKIPSKDKNIIKAFYEKETKRSDAFGTIRIYKAPYDVHIAEYSQIECLCENVTCDFMDDDLLIF